MCLIDTTKHTSKGGILYPPLPECWDLQEDIHGGHGTEDLNENDELKIFLLIFRFYSWLTS